jgi:hypothetical protein
MRSYTRQLDEVQLSLTYGPASSTAQSCRSKHDVVFLRTVMDE